VLIGPAAAGKSTVGRLAAAILNRRFVDLDEVATPYYAEAGWSVERLRRRNLEVVRVVAEREWEPARVHAAERAIWDFPGAVLALGAGHTSYTDRTCRERIEAAFDAVPHVAYLLPSLERCEALQILRRRSWAEKGTDWIADGHDFLAEWLDDPAARALAGTVITTGSDDPMETTGKLAALLHDPGRAAN